MFPQFSGASKSRTINLGNPSSSSSSSVLAKARLERQQRERTRIEIDAACVIQRTWRGRKVAERVKRTLLAEVKEGGSRGEKAAKALVLIFWQGRRSNATGAAELERETILSQWCAASLAEQGLIPQLFLPNDLATLARLCLILLNLISRDASTSNGSIFLHWLETALNAKAFQQLSSRGEREYRYLAEKLVREGYVQCLVDGFQGMPAGKKKHPSTPIIIRLITLFNPLISDSTTLQTHLVPSLANRLLAVPSLPSSIPLQSLTHMCASLHLFETILPRLVGHPDAFSTQGLSTMMGKTCFLANLSTIVVRGGLLARQNGAGTKLWMEVLSGVIEGLPGWMRWLQSTSDGQGDIEMATSADKKAVEPPPAKSLITSAMLLVGPEHLQLLQKSAVKFPQLNMTPFVNLVLDMLESCRGSAAWESIVDNLLEGEEGIALLLTLWRDSVRGKWPSGDAKTTWENIYTEDDKISSMKLPSLVLLSILYTQHLATLPDTEFFSTDPTIRKQTLSLDDVLDLARIWKDLAFMGYWIGLPPRLARGGSDSAKEKKIERRKEYIRGTFTRALTAVCARDARRRFAPEGYWIVTGYYNMESFIEAVCIEETQLEEEQERQAEEAAQPEQETNVIPSAWVRARKAISKRQMALISPRLGLLQNLPMTIPFESRVAIFDEFIYNDRRRLGIERYNRRQGMVQSARIRRTNLSEDGFRELDKLGPLLKTTIQIEFVDQWGQIESGIDGGGLFKEFLTNLAKEVFDPARGLWLTTTQNELWPNPHNYAKESFQLAWYQFLGRVLGKALYEGILVDVAFAGFFLAKWLGRQSYLDDLASLDPELYKGLISLKNYPGDPEDLSLNFVVAEEDFGVTRTVELVRNGANIAVTRSNRTEYIQAMCAYKLNTQIAPQSESFFSGLSDIIDTKWLRMFDQQELQMLIGGVDTPIDVDDLRDNAVTPDGEEDLSIKLFWKVVKSMSQVELKALLRFVTSVGRPPLLGFGSLNPKFGIRLAGDDQTRLPSASACANLLKLPRYRDEYTLRSKLLQAINSNAGFDLS